MALLDLISFFDFQFKNGMTISSLAGDSHTGTFCAVMIKERHFISAYRASYLAKNLILFLIHSYQSPQWFAVQ